MTNKTTENLLIANLLRTRWLTNGILFFIYFILLFIFYSNNNSLTGLGKILALILGTFIWVAWDKMIETILLKFFSMDKSNKNKSTKRRQMMSKLMPKNWGKEEAIIYLMKGALGVEVLELEVVAFEGLVRKYELENFLDLDSARETVTDFVEECFENGTFVIDKPGLLSDVMFDLADEVILWAKDNLSKEDIRLLVNAVFTIMIQDNKIDIGESRLLKSVVGTLYGEGAYDAIIKDAEAKGMTIESNVKVDNLLDENLYWESADGIVFDDWDDWADWLTEIMVLRRKLNPITMLVQLVGIIQQGDMVMQKALMKLSTNDQLVENCKGALAEGGGEIINWFEAIRQENEGCISFNLIFIGDDSSPTSGIFLEDEDENKWTFFAAIFPDNSFKITNIYFGNKEYEVPLMGAAFAKDAGLPAKLFIKKPSAEPEEEFEPESPSEKKVPSKPHVESGDSSIESFREWMASTFDGIKLPKGKSYCEYHIGNGMQVTCMVKKKGIAVYFYSGGKMKAKKLFELINASGLAGKTINDKYTLTPMPGAKNPNIVRMDLLIDTNGLVLDNSDLRNEVKDVFGQLLDLCKPLAQ